MTITQNHTSHIDRISNLTGSVLATFHRGIGDLILHGPILTVLARHLGSRLIIPENDGLPILRLIPELAKIRTVPSWYRNLYILDETSALRALSDAGVTSVLNFRRDRTADQSRYTYFARSLDAKGYPQFDVCEGIDLDIQLTSHVSALSHRFLEGLGISCPKISPGWLRAYVGGVESQQRNSLGFFLGASIAIKRPSLSFWKKTISESVRGLHSRILLIPGKSDEEVAFAHILSMHLTNANVKHVLTDPLDLCRLARLIGEMRCLVTPDTFTLPLAEALGTSVVGVLCSTDARIFGVQHPLNRVICSSYYPICPMKNNVGTCDAWEFGCEHLTCQVHLEPSQVIAATREMMLAERLQ